MIVWLLPCVAATSLTHWFIEHLPGTYGHDIRLLNELVTCDGVDVTRWGCVSVRNLRLGEADCVLEVERFDCTIRVLWRQARIALRLGFNEPTINVIAYDAAFTDTNLRRLYKRLCELQSKSSKSCVGVGVGGLDVSGEAVLCVTPCDRLGGPDLATRIHLDWRRDLEPLTTRVEGFVTFSELCDILTDELSRSFKAAIRNVFLKARLGPTVTKAEVGDTVVRSLADLQTAAKGALASRFTRLLSEAGLADEDVSLDDLLAQFTALRKEAAQLGPGSHDDTTASSPDGGAGVPGDEQV